MGTCQLLSYLRGMAPPVCRQKKTAGRNRGGRVGLLESSKGGLPEEGFDGAETIKDFSFLKKRERSQWPAKVYSG